MRILATVSRFAIIAAALPASVAIAQDVTITDQRTASVLTGTIGTGGTPANLIISNTGQILVTTGSAVTLNSNNTIVNNGVIGSNNANDTTGITVLGGNTGSLTNNATIRLLEDYTDTDTDNDGDLDGRFATGSGRVGILVSGSSPFIGSITNATAGNISVEGNDSFGIRVLSAITGDLVNNGSLSVVGDNGVGIAIGAGISGNIDLNGNITVQGEGSRAIEVTADQTGRLRIGSRINATGFRSIVRATTAEARARLDANDLLAGGPAVSVRANLTRGLEIVGIGIEDDDDDDGDGIPDNAPTNPDTDDNLTGSIETYGSGPAIEVLADATSGNLTFGAARDGFGFYNRGAITANGVNDGFAATAVRLATSGGRTLNIEGGFANDRLIGAVSYEASATGLDVGSGVTLPNIRNRNAISVQANTDGDHDATAILIRSGATVNTMTNSGQILARVRGETGDAVALRDLTGLLNIINNTGTIQADIFATSDNGDTDLTITGRAIALDLSANTTGIRIIQSPDVPFSDDDTTDDDVNQRPQVAIIGDILLGSGADIIEQLAGNITGDIYFGAGADVFRMDTTGRFAGRLFDSDGDLSLDIRSGTLALEAGSSQIRQATFGAGSILDLTLGGTPQTSTQLIASGDVTFLSGARITAAVPTGLPEDGAVTFLRAARLIGASNVTGTITGAGVPFLYNVSINTLAGDANALEARYRLKTEAELGLNRRQSPAFRPLVEAMRRDATANVAFSGLENSADFLQAYNQLLPNHASASAELAAIAIDQAQRVTTNRLEAGRISGIRNDTFWFQEIAFGVDRTAEDFGVDYRGYGFGLAAGVDGPLQNGGIFGLSVSMLASEVEEPQRRFGSMSNTLVQANAYAGFETGAVNIDVVAGGGFGQFSSERLVDIGPSFNATAESDWWGGEAHASVQASAPFELTDKLTLTPKAGLTFISLYEQEYEEEGAGQGINLALDGVNSNRLWGEAAVTMGYDFGVGENTVTPRLTVGYRHDLIEDVADRTARFVSGGDDFTLVDEAISGGGALLGFGLEAGGPWSNVNVTYEGEFRDGLKRHSLNAAVRFRF